MEIEKTTFNVGTTKKGNFKITKINYFRNGRTYTREFFYGFKTEEEALEKIKFLKYNRK
jgi:hypothetical protein